MATKRLRNGSWYYVVRRALLPRPLYLTFRDQAEGDEYVRRLEAQLDRGLIPHELIEAEAAATLRSHVVRYMREQHVSAGDQACLNIVVARLPSTLELKALTFAWAQSWITRMKREDNLSPVTIRHHVGALARCLDWLAASGDVPFNPLRSLPKGYAVYTAEDTRQAIANDGQAKTAKERDRRLEPGEEARIREILAGEKPEGRQRALALPEAAALTAMFDLALESGMRMREMFTLDVRQVDLARRTIFLDRTKNGSKRQVPLTSVARKVLTKYLRKHPGGQLFPWWDGKPQAKSLARTTSQLSRQYKRIFLAAGCEDLNFHDLRHEATSRLFERTQLSEMEIAKITGHKDLRSLARYANLRGSKLAARLW
ncbi:MAG TPA: site-specific integrase [Dokdonella sp.]|uniref:site-specific integrase n=1 Tax=Dokdonella sp. TaxID=2291710 RepID=UPI002BEC0DE0|nr:site-specific integrase [Dokdonella sp.]HUD42005.1 site-specific integrase [Dokdonella sp.]